MSVRFSNQLVAEAIQPFWAALQAGESLPTHRRWPARTVIAACSGCARRVACVRAAAAI